MVESDVAVAVPAALDYCVRNKLDVPPWLAVVATELLCDLMKREKSTKRGRARGFVARHRQDRIDYARWDQVKVVRQKQIELHEQVAALRALPHIPPGMLQERQRMLDWVGCTLNRAYECAALLLEGSEAFGGPDAIKRSYFQVERNSHDPGQILRYHLLDPRFLSRLGLKHEIEVRPGKKHVPLYTLVL